MDLIRLPSTFIIMGISEHFYQIDPHHFLSFIEGLGFETTGQVYQLNSYENRVFDIFLENQKRIVAKFYRPERWTKQSIQQEHAFSQELAADGFPIIAPMTIDGTSVFEWKNMFVAIFPRAAGRNPDEIMPKDFSTLGGYLARLHNVGAKKIADQRLTIGAEDFLYPAEGALQNFVAPEVKNRYFAAVEQIITYFEERYNPHRIIRLQGDCHKGNLIHNGEDFVFVDFDDFCNGPAVQDLWMLTYSPDPEEREENFSALLEGYTKLRDWDESEEQYIEALRALRIVHYAGWIARRWQDPHFPKLFPQFLTYSYWAEEAEALEKIVWTLE
ncbi:MAG: serine/threonine protein kinase [Bdellovibrionales bacterium]|nr:serine/threonine protein kinase [Bdellovibrionales bacterium]